MQDDLDQRAQVRRAAAELMRYERRNLWARAQMRQLAARSPLPLRSKHAALSDNVAQDTDLANAVRLCRDYGDRLRYVAPWSDWVWFTGTRWQRNRLAAELAAKKTAANLFAELGKRQGEDRDRMYAWAKRSAMEQRIMAMLNVARSDLGVDAGHFDRDPEILNTPSGTVDLRSLTLRRHDPTDLLTKMTSVGYEPDAKAHRWRRFLEEVFDGDLDLISWLQRFAGYAATGYVRERLFIVAHGVGWNGKSTFTGALQDVLGDYAIEADPELLMEHTGEYHPTGQADLFRSRLVVLAETRGGKRIDAATVKRLTGMDRIRTRRMREDFWEFLPTHKLWLNTNDRPEVRQGGDQALWDRIVLIPFEVRFDGARSDKGLGAKLRAEAPGILRWVAQGARDYLEEGLEPRPEKVTIATEAYRADIDSVGRFLAECCTIEVAFTTQAGLLRDTYRAWCERSGMTPLRDTLWSDRLARVGLTKEHSRTGWLWRGVGLTEGRR